MKQNKVNKKIKSFDGIVRKVLVQEVQESNLNTFSSKDLLLSGIKVFGVTCITLVLSFGLSRVGGTASYYSNIAKSEANKLMAGTLSINISSVEDLLLRTVQSENTDELPVEEVLEEDVTTGSLQFDVRVGSDGSLPVAYTVQGKLDEGNPVGCEEVTILANIGVYSYDGFVNNFLSPKMTDLGEWNFMVSLPVTSKILAPGAVCSGSVVFRAEILGVAENLSGTYTDVKTYTFKLKNWESVVPASFSALEVEVPLEEEIVVPEEVVPEEAVSDPVPDEVSEESIVEVVPLPTPEEVVVDEPIIESPVVEVLQPVVEPVTE